MMELTDILDMIAMPALAVDDDGIVTAMNAACRGSFDQAIRLGTSLAEAAAGLAPGEAQKERAEPDDGVVRLEIDGINVRMKVVRLPLHDDVAFNVLVLSRRSAGRDPALSIAPVEGAPPPAVETRSVRGYPVDPLGAVERAAIAEEVASVVRHDLRNSLASIRNAAFYLKRRTTGTHLWEADARVPQFFTLIDDMVVGATKMVEERLGLQHLFTRRVRRVRGRECVERATACARVQAAVTLATDAGPHEIEVDVSEVALAIRCLVENAAEATGAGGRVKVSARAVGLDFVVEVTDDGPGVADVARDKIFRAFHTTRDGHAGLGLSIARRVARRYGGDVVLRPAAAGACFALSVKLGDPDGATGES